MRMTRTNVAALLLALAAEGTLRAQERTDATSAKTAAATAEEDKANRQVALEDENIRKLHGMYDLARDVVGKQHVTVSPVVFAGHRCATGTNVYRCPTPVEGQGGVAGLVIVPLWGFGGNHGAELWPRVQTDTVGDGFRQFDRSFRRLRDAASGPLGLPAENQASAVALTGRFQARAQAFDALLTRLIDTEAHAYYHDDIKHLRDCLGALTAGPVILGDASTSPAPVPPEQSCAAGIAHGGQARGWTAKQKLKYLEDLWSEYDMLVQENPVSRHNLLIGPLAGVSITDDFGDILYGGGFEAGFKDWFRFTAGAGFRSSMHGRVRYANFDDTGWWFGLGLSGQLGDQLIDAILGVHRIFASGTGGDP